MKKRLGKILTFSGLDGAGKSTQIALLKKRMSTNGEALVYLWTRGGYTSLFGQAKRLLRLVLGKKIPPSGPNPHRTQALQKTWIRRLWLTAALLDLLRVYGVQVRWWRWRGRTVLCDRYLADAYIDFRLHWPQEDIEQWRLWRLLRRLTPRPDVSFLFLIPVSESVRRSEIKGEPFPDLPETLCSRLQLYQALLLQGNWRVMDGLRSIPTLAEEVQLTLKQL